MSSSQNFHAPHDQYIEIKGDFVAGDLIIIQTIVLPDPPPPLWVDVPAAPTHKIIGREAIRNDLFERLTNQTSLPVTLNGLSGVGKTTLALLATYHPAIQEKFPDGVLWGSCGPLPNIPGILNRWGEALGRPISHLPTLAEKASAVKQLIGTRKVLLVLDDVWELEDAEVLLCGGPNCAHLLTTPEQTIGRKLTDDDHAIHLASLTTAESVAILSQLAPQAYKEHPEPVQQIAAACGGLPLAVVLIGGYLEEQGGDESGLFDDLTAEALAHVADPAARLQLINDQMGGSLSLQDTLTLSLDIVSTEARDAFFKLGVFAPRPDTFSRAAAEKVVQTDGRVLLELTRHNLLEVSHQQLAIHPLLADFAKTKAEPAAVTRHWGYYLTEVQKDPEDWQHIENIYGQIRWAWQAADAEQQFVYLDNLHLYQMRRGLWEDWLAWGQKVVANADEHHLPAHKILGFNAIGQVYDFLGQPDKALEYMQQMLTLAQAQDNEVQQAAALTNIARCYDQLDQPTEALNYYDQALPLVQAIGDRLNEAKVLNNIGLVYDALQQPAQALAFYQKSLPIRIEVGDRAGAAVTLNNIGFVLYQVREFNEALAFYQEAHQLYQAIGYRDGEARNTADMATVYATMGELEKAKELYQNALTIFEEIGNKPGITQTKENLTVLAEAIATGGTISPPQNTANIANTIAELFQTANENYSQGAFEQAYEQYQQLLTLLPELGADEAPELRSGEALIYFNLANIYYQLQKFEDALTLFQKSLVIMQEIGDQENEINALTSIGQVYIDLNQPQYAVMAFEKAYEVAQSSGNYPAIAQAKYNIAYVYAAYQNLEAAVDEMTQAAKLMEQIGHPEATNYAAVLKDLQQQLQKAQGKKGFFGRLFGG